MYFTSVMIFADEVCMMIRDVKMIIADIDGTLVKKGEKEMMPKTREMLTEFHEKGVLFGIASGRPVDEKMKARKNEWKLSFDFDVMIGMNGGQLWDRFHKGIEEYYTLDTDTMREILDLMRPFHLIASIYEGDHMVATALDRLQVESIERNQMEFINTHGDEDRLCIRPVNKILFRYDRNEKEMMEYINAHKSGKYQGVITYPGLVEFFDPRVSKGMALKKCAERNKINIENILAFGDLDNDNEMLKEAGWGVALLNGGEETKRIADEITEFDVEHDGVGRYLEKLLEQL